MGLIRPTAPYEVWSYSVLAPTKHALLKELVERGDLVPVEVEGVKAHATPAFLSLLDLPSLEQRVVFIAPLDQLMWDRKMVAHLFGFDYVWEIYMPEPKRRWGYYVLPVLYGDALVARVEFWSRDGVLEIRKWHDEPSDPGSGFHTELERSLRNLMHYCSAHQVVTAPGVNSKIRDLAKRLG